MVLCTWVAVKPVKSTWSMPMPARFRRVIERWRALIALSGVFLFAHAGSLSQHARAEAPAGPRAPDLLIVAPKRFHPALATYVEKRNAERPTHLVALEKVLKETAGVDDPERLKRFLFDAWRTRRVGYALLVGDADVLPVRYMVLDRVTPAAFDYAFYPSDLYYADLAHEDGSFDDWNANKEGFHATYFGEVRGEKNKEGPINFDKVSYRPELAVGRWPVSDENEVKVVAEKSLAYEARMKAGDAPGLRTAALLSVGGWVDTRGFMNSLATSLPAGWSAEKRYDDGPKRTRANADASAGAGPAHPDEKQVVDLLNSGVSLMLHTGHGSDDRWEGSFALGALGRVHNADRLPVIMSAGCSTARFATLPPYEPYADVNGLEHPGTNAGELFKSPPPPPAVYAKGRFNLTGLGEQLVKHGPDGAVAYIGCNTGSQPCALTLLEGFAKAQSAKQEPTIGDCWVRAIDHYYEKEHLAQLVPTESWYPASIFFQGMKFMLFGDPSLRLPGPEPATAAGR